mgnify:CR=1 FL=1
MYPRVSTTNSRWSRRSVLGGLALAALPAPAFAANVGVDLAPAGGDQTAAFQAGLDRATAEKRPFVLGPGTYRIGAIRLPDGAQITGVAGLTTLTAADGGLAISGGPAKRIVLSGLGIDGRERAAAGAEALVHLIGVEELRVADCLIGRGTASGLLLDRCGGRVERNAIAACGAIGVFARDSRRLTIADNSVTDCGDGGILVHRAQAGDDGTIVSRNRVERIAARSGGTGQVGNGINTFRAGGVAIVENRISDCALSGIRVNGGGNLRIVGNEVTRSGETALYVEFEFTGAVVASNVIDTAAMGISVVNFMQGGRLAVVSGNLVRNITRPPPYPAEVPGMGFGITVEADATITGNVVESVTQAGILVGWDRYLRDVAVTGNVVRGAPIGLFVSVDGAAGPAILADNLISGAKTAIQGQRHGEPVGGDMLASGAQSFPHLTLSGNRAAK